MSLNKNLSLYIPFVFPNFDKDYVSYSFSEVGEVERVDFVPKLDKYGKNYNSVYIHFKEWFESKENEDFQFELLKNGSEKWYHDNSNYYWTVLPNKTSKHNVGARKPRINLKDLVEAPKEEEVEVEMEFQPEDFAEIAQLLEEDDDEDKNLISIDWRYVKELESENQELRTTLARLQYYERNGPFYIKM